MSDVLTNAAKALYGNGGDPFDPAKPTVGLALVREAVARLGWGTMVYRCEACGYEARVWLSLGVEGPQVLRDASLYLACPFTMRCWACAGKPVEAGDPLPPAPFNKQPLNGTMSHVRFDHDEHFDPLLIPDNAARFVLPTAVWGGSEGADIHVPSGALAAGRRWFYGGEVPGE
jgi:hypothetical protein